MHEPFTEWAAWAWSTALSLGSVALGTLAKYFHVASRHEKPVAWRRMLLEAPTVAGMALAAGPLSEYVATNYGVHQGVTAALCFLLGYLSTNILDAVETWIERRGKRDDDESQ